MTNNPDCSMNSDNNQHPCERVPTRITSNSELMTESEVIEFLRIPEISNSKDYHNVIENLKRMHQRPRTRICGKPLYPRGAIKEWIKRKTINGE